MLHEDRVPDHNWRETPLGWIRSALAVCLLNFAKWLVEMSRILAPDERLRGSKDLEDGL